MGDMKLFVIALVLSAAACTKKPAPKAPEPAAPAAEPTNVQRTAPAVKGGDPCAGGEKK
jgi:hypothetical protein